MHEQETKADLAEVHQMLVGTLGSNLVWGTIGGVIYLLGALVETARCHNIVCAVRSTSNVQHAQTLISDPLPAAVAVLVFLPTFLVATPFFILPGVLFGLRFSNAIVILMLFGVGYRFGRVSGLPAWLIIGTGLLDVGALMVSLCTPLGGYEL
jgi:hypothetical protein